MRISDWSSDVCSSDLVGQARALGLALTAEPLPAEKAAEWGLIWKAVEDEALDAEVDALATRFASAPTQGLAAIKTMIRESWGHTLDEELDLQRDRMRSEEHTSELQSLMRISYAVFCLKKKNKSEIQHT